MDKVPVKYMGNGKEFLHGVPAKDHDTDEEQLDRLLASGLYKTANTATTTKGKVNKDG